MEPKAARRCARPATRRESANDVLESCGADHGHPWNHNGSASCHIQRSPIQLRPRQGYRNAVPVLFVTMDVAGSWVADAHTRATQGKGTHTAASRYRPRLSRSRRRGVPAAPRFLAKSHWPACRGLPARHGSTIGHGRMYVVRPAGRRHYSIAPVMRAPENNEQRQAAQSDDRPTDFMHLSDDPLPNCNLRIAQQLHAPVTWGHLPRSEVRYRSRAHVLVRIPSYRGAWRRVPVLRRDPGWPRLLKSWESGTAGRFISGENSLMSSGNTG